MTWWLINPVADQLIFDAPFSKQWWRLDRSWTIVDSSGPCIIDEYHRGCFRLWMFTVEKCQWTFMIVAKLECLFSTKLETSRIALITWPCDWLIQLLTDLFSLHFFFQAIWWGPLVIHERWLIPADHTYIFGYHRECFRLWMFTVEKCCSGLYDRCKARTFLQQSRVPHSQCCLDCF